MRVFIAEKPSLANAIAEGLGGGKKTGDYITCGNDVVTWCFGHLFELASPDMYSSTLKQWSRDTLPIIPPQWKIVPRKGATKQIGVIRSLVRKGTCSLVINAGDPDREGQLLVDELLGELGYRGPVQRLWLASLDPKSVAKALSSMQDNRAFLPLSQAALARSRADWLVGINATRAMTLLGRERGMDGVLSLGRVQTPTLALVVQRDRERANFVPCDYLVLHADLGTFRAALALPEGFQGQDSEGRLVDRQVAIHIQSEAPNSKGRICEMRQERKTQVSPLPYTLSELQKDASAKLGLSAKQVLDVAQRLYEKRLTTYPRTDCPYLPEEQFNDAQSILAALAPVHFALADADPSLRSSAWSTAKVTAHHGIIPTGQIPQNLTTDESSIFGLIALRYALQFHKPHVYDAQRITVELGQFLWVATGIRELVPGWSMYNERNNERKETKESITLPMVSEGDEVFCASVMIEEKKTSPLAAFTEGTLIEAMSKVHRFVTDPQARKSLKENEGLGTEATRAGILETLKLRGYLKTEKKALISTKLGATIIDLTPQVLKDPVTTARWETRLNDIADGKERLGPFMAEQERYIPDILRPIFEAKPAGVGVRDKVCPSCGKAMRRLPSKKERGKFFWACFDNSHEKPVFLPEEGNGKTLVATSGKRGRKSSVEDGSPPKDCPTCGKSMKRLPSKKEPGTFFWACFDNSHEKPVFLPGDMPKPRNVPQRKGGTAR